MEVLSRIELRLIGCCSVCIIVTEDIFRLISSQVCTVNELVSKIKTLYSKPLIAVNFNGYM